MKVVRRQKPAGASVENPSPLFVRLVRLGARDELLRALRAEWDASDDQGKRVAMESIAAMTDDELRTVLEARNAQPHQPHGVPDGSVADVMAWVGKDVDRARRAAWAEGRRPAQRATLIRQLDTVLNGQG